MRKVIFFVQTMHWDNIHSCYYASCLLETDSYEEAEKFCLNYEGKEISIYIQKAFKK